MRRLIGCLVLVGGVVALGYVASSNHAARMQASIATRALGVIENGAAPLQVRVAGRDVSVSGQVMHAAVRDTIQTTLQNIDGVRVVDISGLDTLPLADPYEMRFSVVDGAVKAVGVVPTQNAVTMFPPASDLTLAAGMPDEDWLSFAARIPDVVAQIQSGTAVLSGRNLTLEGILQTPDDRDAILAALTLPNGYRLTNSVTVRDDGTPLRLSLTLRDGGVYGGGKLPADMALADITAQFAIGEPLDLIQSVIPAADTQWPDVARTSMQALAATVNADLTLTSNSVTLTGVATPDGRAEAVALLADLPSSYAITTDIGIWDDRLPLRMVMDWDGETANATGKLPADFALLGPAGVNAVTDVQTSFLPDTDGAFTLNANAGIGALGVLENGTLEVTKDTIILNGTAASPRTDVGLDSALANVAEGTEITRTITYLDDGSPAAWTLRYATPTGATLEGRLPLGLTVDDIATTLGLPVDGAPVTAVEDDDLGTSLDTLAIAARYLPEVERMTYALNTDGSALDLVLSPGVDIDLVATDLAEVLPADVAFSLGPLETLPPEGTQRTNTATGLDEVFTGGFWLPDLDFTADVAGCTAASDAILTGAQVNFLSASARLDATSIRAINGLAAVVRPCLNAGLRLEIGGHTDDTGNAASNDALSFDRAEQVRAALIDRGATADVMTPVGYGQTQPIADNETAQGRAQNRRTTLVWTQP